MNEILSMFYIVFYIVFLFLLIYLFVRKFYIVFLFLLIYLFVRNKQTHELRGRVSDEISKHNSKCIRDNTYKTKKLEYPELSNKPPTYHEMVWEFWIPIKKQEERLRINLGLKPRK